MIKNGSGTQAISAISGISAGIVFAALSMVMISSFVLFVATAIQGLLFSALAVGAANILLVIYLRLIFFAIKTSKNAAA